MSHDCSGLKCTLHWGDCSLKLPADQLLVLIDHRLGSIISHICQGKGHMTNKLLTSSIWSLQGNLRLTLMYWPRYGTVSNANLSVWDFPVTTSLSVNNISSIYNPLSIWDYHHHHHHYSNREVKSLCQSCLYPFTKFSWRVMKFHQGTLTIMTWWLLQTQLKNLKNWPIVFQVLIHVHPRHPWQLTIGNSFRA